VVKQEEALEEDIGRCWGEGRFECWSGNTTENTIKYGRHLLALGINSVVTTFGFYTHSFLRKNKATSLPCRKWQTGPPLAAENGDKSANQASSKTKDGAKINLKSQSAAAFY
jgi:hypothetical protein